MKNDVVVRKTEEDIVLCRGSRTACPCLAAVVSPSGGRQSVIDSTVHPNHGPARAPPASRLWFGSRGATRDREPSLSIRLRTRWGGPEPHRRATYGSTRAPSSFHMYLYVYPSSLAVVMMSWYLHGLEQHCNMTPASPPVCLTRALPRTRRSACRKYMYFKRYSGPLVLRRDVHICCSRRLPSGSGGRQ